MKSSLYVWPKETHEISSFMNEDPFIARVVVGKSFIMSLHKKHAIRYLVSVDRLFYITISNVIILKDCIRSRFCRSYFVYFERDLALRYC